MNQFVDGDVPTEVMEEFHPKDATVEQWSAYHELRKIREAELRPDDPIAPDDLIERTLTQGSSHQHKRYFWHWVDRRLVATLTATTSAPEAPDYEENKSLIWVDIYVHPSHRRRGIGTAFLGTVREVMDQTGTTMASAATEQDSGRRFLERLGAEERLQGAENRLEFGQIEWQMVEEWIQHGRERSPQTQMELYENRLPDDLLSEYAPVYTEVLNQQPFDELEIGRLVITPEVFTEQYRRLNEAKGFHDTLITREPDGSISGLTEVLWFPHRPSLLTQNLTGVAVRHRGRGLGKWLKAAMLEHARDRWPDLEWVVTGNARSNQSMISINRRLGFREYRRASLYQISKAGWHPTLCPRMTIRVR